MSKVIAIMGVSGSGKTTSLRNLDPQETYYIDCDKKGLSWKGWKQQYNKENKNYLLSSDSRYIQNIIKGISDKAPHIKNIAIDTLNGIMIDKEMSTLGTKGYDKWADLASEVYDLVSTSGNYRDDLNIILMFHAMTDRDDNGYMFTRILTNGRKLDKICLETKLNTVLLAKVKNGKYIFETHANNSTAKTPLGAFEKDEIDNDIAPVIKALEEY